MGGIVLGRNQSPSCCGSKSSVGLACAYSRPNYFRQARLVAQSLAGEILQENTNDAATFSVCSYLFI